MGWGVVPGEIIPWQIFCGRIFSLDYLNLQKTQISPNLSPGVFNRKWRVPENIKPKQTIRGIERSFHLQRHRQSKSCHADQNLVEIEAMVGTAFEKYRRDLIKKYAAFEKYPPATMP
jgi:hypothetical protein